MEKKTARIVYFDDEIYEILKNYEIKSGTYFPDVVLDLVKAVIMLDTPNIRFMEMLMRVREQYNKEMNNTSSKSRYWENEYRQVIDALDILLKFSGYKIEKQGK